jgi:phosphatidylserine synthase
MFGAKLAALVLFIGLLVAAITLLSSIAIPSIASGSWETRSLWLRISALLIGAVGACFFTFFSLLAIQGLLLLLLPVRWFEATSFGLQAILLLLFLCAFPLLPYFPAHHLAISRPTWIV